MIAHDHAVARRIRELEQLNPPLTAPADLDAYWEAERARFAAKPLNAERRRIETPFPYMQASRVEFEGFDRTRIAGWFLRPAFAGEGPLPCVVFFHGYTGSKGFPEQYGQYLLMGLSVFVVDVRGQGGETGNLMAQEFGMIKGWITQGILDRDTCYYKAVTIDALKALQWAAEQPDVDPGRICVQGVSQGGGLAMIAAALSDVPAAAVTEIPNMCHMDFGILNSTGSLTEAAQFVERFPDKLGEVLTTLSYFDNMNLAGRISVPILVSCGLKDTVCMPETIFAAYNRIAAPKRINVYPFSGHTVTAYQNREALRFIARQLGLPGGAGEEENGESI